MGVSARATKHAGSLYRRTFDAVLRPVRRVEAEAHHLREIEEVGESGETPFIVILGVILFVAPIFAVMVGLAFTAYYPVG